MLIKWMVLATAVVTVTSVQALAWDSVKRNPTHPTHSYLTEYAISNSGDAEARKFSAQLIEGANQELHELQVKGSFHGINLNAKRIEHKGTNAGTDDIAGWWSDAKKAYKSGNKDIAYFEVGIILHMIEDMGVPAHANGVYHQGNLREFDNFEFISVSNWKPDYSKINKPNPNFNDPSDYYEFSKAWTHEDAPDYDNRDSFSKTWPTASGQERNLVRMRQARTAAVAAWALKSAIKSFHSLK